MSVYFATCRELGLVKIGHATNPKRRWQGLQTGCPKPLTLEAQFEGGEREERELHTQFAEHRERGEWFRICPEIDAVIDQHKPPAPAQTRDLEQGEWIGPFHYDPEGWLKLFGDTEEEYPVGIQNWLARKERELA